MRSTRCIGKNTTPSENGSPSFTSATRSSKDASSIPRKLNPSALKARIDPQNFSRGLANVTTTIVPGWKGFSVPGTDGAEGARFCMFVILNRPLTDCNFRVPAKLGVQYGVW